MSWFEANKFCKNIGAKLVEINSEEENAAIVDEINKRKFQEKKMYFWIGLTDLRKEGVWKLESNGATANYQNWDESYKDNPEPNNHGGNEDCAHLRVGPCSRWRDGWADLQCGESSLYITTCDPNDKVSKPEVWFSMNPLCEFEKACNSDTSEGGQ